MQSLIQNAIGLYIGEKTWHQLEVKLQQLPFSAETDGDKTLATFLSNYYMDFNEMELVTLLADNLNSLLNADGSTKKDNECSYLVRNKVLVLWRMLDERKNAVAPVLLADDHAQ